MNRWQMAPLLATAYQLFEKIRAQQRLAHPNHEVHFLARERDWLVRGIQAILSGNYTPRFLRRTPFKEETVDALHPSDRIFQTILLKQLKSTFKYVCHPQCFHLHGPHGVKLATQHIQHALEVHQPAYFIRADIKSYYASISHCKLIQTLKKNYQDSKVQAMLEQIIRNPIDTRRGLINPDTGIPIRGPLSAFFSALYLKPLDEAFSKTQVTYVRFQDDILILCQTKRQLNRCRLKLKQILAERQLSLSRKKSRQGKLEKGFHFLGIDYYSGTRIPDNSAVAVLGKEQVLRTADKTSSDNEPVSNAAFLPPLPSAPLRVRLHARTYRNARKQVERRVAYGFSATQIRRYLLRWDSWWMRVRAR